MIRPDHRHVARALRERITPTRSFEAARRFDLACPADAAALAQLLDSEAGLLVRDQLVPQVAELVHARNPTHKRNPARDAEVCATFLRDHDPDSYGCWVYYPWRRTLVRLLPEAEFVELRSARNQLHVSAAEQRLLRARSIGVVGLSVGYSMAVTLALEGVGGSFRLADFDQLELSNTNRVGCGVTGLGQNKAVLAARTLLEIDPYLRVEVHERGIHADNARPFFTEGGRLDVLIEECDDLPMKLYLRELARELGVPVITESSQRGLLDVERFDLEPERPPFHGLMGEISAAQLARLSTREKAPFLLRFLRGTENMSTTLAASLVEIEQSLAGWPQLASSVALGGAVVADATRRLLLGSLSRSGRYQVDMEAIVNDGAAALLREPMTELPEPIAASPRTEADAADALARWVGWASLAPSGGNVQPWSFEERADGSLDCRLALRGAPSALDPDARAARVACGAALANLTLAAAQDGVRTELEWEPNAADPALLYRCRFRPDPTLPPDELGAFVSARCTNRRIGEHRPLPSGALAALQQEAARWGGSLVAHQSEAALEAIGHLLGALERVRLFSKPFYDEMMGELVDAPQAPLGISLDTLELGPADRAALQILRRRDVVSLLRREQRGNALIDLAKKPVRAAAAVCLLHVAGHTPRAALQGGVALQRVWLRATQLGLALQPVSAGLYMLQQLAEPGRLAEWERAQLLELEPTFARYFPVPADRSGVLVFRLFEAEPPSARSARLPLADVLRRANLERADAAE
jgi:molybdopterin/thiamine biosynthesis adenylyltransferase/nitroreductase